jgi:hypothetical protein
MAIHSRVEGGKIATKGVLVGAALLSAQIIPAMAADMAPLDRVPIAPAFNWTDVYLGADIGGAWSTIHREQPGDEQRQ